MLNTFRMLSLIEGSSLIILLFIAMPAKYHFGYFDAVWLVGMTHGLLWLAYVALSLPVSHKQNWSVTFWMLVLLASVVPFACFFLDGKLKRELLLARE
jgi:integral membrane protein